MPEVRSWGEGQLAATHHAVMNATFIGSGLRVALAGLVLAPVVPRRGRWAVLPLFIAYAIGQVIVGAFPTALAGTRATMHGIGAVLAIVGGGLLLLAIAFAFSQKHPAFATFTGVCAAISLAASLAAVFLTTHFGLCERIAIYAVIIWQIIAGVVVLATRPPGRSVDVRQGE